MQWQGTVTRGDEYRVGSWGDDEELTDGDILIGGKDFLHEVESATWNGPVIVGIGDARFLGDLEVDSGWGYSEYTPVDPDRLRVGQHDILSYLRNLEGQEVVVTISDEAINLVEVKETALKELER